MMFNVLLDPLPEDYEGFRINSDFRTGVKMWLAVSDPDLNDLEKAATCIDLLFGNDIGSPLPDAQIAQEGIAWFLNGWYTDGPTGKASKVPVMDLNVDQWRIYSAFRHEYGIDLDREDMHYWVFMGLLTTLGKCAFTQVVDLRTQKPPKGLKGEELRQFRALKAQYAIQVPESIEEAEERRLIAEEFLSHVKINRGNNDG